MAGILEQRGISLLRTSVRAVLPDAVRDQDGRLHPCTGLFWATQADAVDWPGLAGLAVDARGFIAVDGTLRSISHPRIFAVGDIASLTDRDCPKAGSVALRQGRYLAANLHAALTGAPLGSFQPPAAVLSLIGTGDGYAVAWRGAWAVEGRWAWRLKDYIDRRFVRSCRAA
jgi:selenide,water dikinase